MPENKRKQHAHLMVCQILADAVTGTGTEGLESGVVVFGEGGELDVRGGGAW